MKVCISLSSTGFILDVPSVLDDRTHEVEVPATEAGISIIRKILAARQREVRAYLGTVASPTQAQVEAWLRQDRAERAKAKAIAETEKETERAAAAKSVIGDIDLGELDL